MNKLLLFLSFISIILGPMIAADEGEKKKELPSVASNTKNLAGFYIVGSVITETFGKALKKSLDIANADAVHGIHRGKERRMVESLDKATKILPKLGNGITKASAMLKMPLQSAADLMVFPAVFCTQDVKTMVKIYSSSSRSEKDHLKSIMDARSWNRSGKLINASRGTVLGFGIPLLAMHCYQKFAIKKTD